MLFSIFHRLARSLHGLPLHLFVSHQHLGGRAAGRSGSLCITWLKKIHSPARFAGFRLPCVLGCCRMLSLVRVCVASCTASAYSARTRHTDTPTSRPCMANSAALACHSCGSHPFTSVARRSGQVEGQDITQAQPCRAHSGTCQSGNSAALRKQGSSSEALTEARGPQTVVCSCAKLRSGCLSKNSRRSLMIRRFKLDFPRQTCANNQHTKQNPV